MSTVKKAFNRIVRIISGKKGVYGKIGENNKYTTGVYITEGARVGNNNYFGPYTMINHAHVGNYCSIGPGVKVGQGNHSKDYITTYQKISGELIGHSLSTKPAVIGNDVWCGANSVILQGVKIGDGAIIGANAVVTKDVPDYAIVAGVPATIKSFRFDEKIIKIIKSSNWFNYEIDQAKTIIKSLEAKIKDAENL